MEKQLILLVDDDNIAHIVTKRILSEDFRLQSAYSGEEALRMMEEGEVPVLVLMDVKMTGMDGFETFRKMRESETLRRIPVLFVTSKEDTELEEKCLEEGAADYVRKPFSPRVLYRRVRNTIDLAAFYAERGRRAET